MSKPRHCEAQDKYITVVLVGNHEEKLAFIHNLEEQWKITGEWEEDFPNDRLCKIAKFNFYNFKKDLNSKCHPGDEVVIYLNATPEQKNAYENERDAKKCIAIDFNALKVSPGECMDSIEYLMKIMPKLLRRQKLMKEEDESIRLHKFFLIKNSIFHEHYPDETMLVLKQMLMGLNIFSASSPKPIFIELPPIPHKEKEKQEASRATRLTERSNHPGCAMQ